MKKVKLMLGDNIESLKKLPENSIDSIVSDPPYGLSFMGKKWDYDVPSVEFWKEVYRVLKPGGHILSFGGTRTYHRMVVNIEDAGFEIRDQVMWLYGSGFPKSHNIGKAVDKLEGNEREVVGVLENYQNKKGVNAAFLTEEVINENRDRIDIPLTKGNSPYEGWGTALKPANEPICVARKPLSEKTIAENVIKWGTGGINIDGCRIGIEGKDLEDRISQENSRRVDNNNHNEGFLGSSKIEPNLNVEEGRFPANIILDETTAELLDLQSGISKPSKGRTGRKGGTNESEFSKAISADPDFIGKWPADNGGKASRFFYVAKVSKKERNLGLDGFDEKTIHDDKNKYGIEKFNTLPKKNNHPTLKPINLMTYLCRLVTPEGGIVLDPFMGSGSTGISALLEGFRFIGMEQDKSYFDIASARIEAYEEYRKLLK